MNHHTPEGLNLITLGLAGVAEKLTEVCQKTSLSKTAATERAIQMYYKHYKKTGKV